MDVTPTSANVMEYVSIVRDKALLRALYTAAGEISAMVQDGTGGASNVLDAAEQKIYAVRRGRSAQSMASIGVVLQGVLDHLSELSANGGRTLPGLPTGFGVLDDRMNGLNKSGPCAAGRASRYGQNEYGAEPCAERRPHERAGRGHLLARNVA